MEVPSKDDSTKCSCLLHSDQQRQKADTHTRCWKVHGRISDLSSKNCEHMRRHAGLRFLIQHDSRVQLLLARVGEVRQRLHCTIANLRYLNHMRERCTLGKGALRHQCRACESAEGRRHTGSGRCIKLSAELCLRSLSCHAAICMALLGVQHTLCGHFHRVVRVYRY